jgi:hypothetical protein
VTAYGDFIYSNNPKTSLLYDNPNIPDITNLESKLVGYKQAGTPQQAYSLGIEYRNPKFWWIGANANYLSHNYIDVATITRTSKFYDPLANQGIIINPELANSYLKQEKFKPIQLVNLVGGKSWRIKNNTIGLFANTNNLFNKIYKTGGFEQARSSTYKNIFQDKSGGGQGPFGPKYFYGYGRTYTLSLYLNF